MIYARDTAIVATPIGTIAIDGDSEQLYRLRILAQNESIQPTGSNPLLKEAEGQLNAWFAGKTRSFDLPLAPMTTSRGTALRAGLIAVRYGETLTYAGLANRLESAPRAIGQLCARNPFPIIVPCHRILSTGNGPQSYSAEDGAITKNWLLVHEQAILNGVTNG